MQFLAGDTADLYYDKTTRAFVPDGAGPRFTVATLDYWQAQAVLDATRPAVDRIRDALKMGLTAIDGDPDKAAQFLAKPRATLVNPLFDAIVEAAAGN